MTLMTESEIRQAFASLRKLTSYTGPHGHQTCLFEEALVELAQREARAPMALTRVDGFPAGGNGGGGVSRNDAGQPTSSTERATLALLDADQPGARHADPVGERTVSALFTLANMAASSQLVRDRITEAQQMSGQKKPVAHVAEVCVEEGCDELAVPGGRGRCDADRKWLERHPEVQHVPTKVIERRNERRAGKSVHIDGPLAPDHDPLIERLVDDYEETAP